MKKDSITKENVILENILNIGRKIIPKKIFIAAQPLYHYLLAITGAILYQFPSRKLIVIGITGTKGKSTSTEMVNAILEANGAKTALANTIRYKIGNKSEKNTYKMTMMGRFFTQSFLYKAVKSGCTHAVLEMSSESVLQYRHKFIYLDALIFTNLSPEHIERHGSYENYVNAKIEIAKILETTPKKNPVIIANADDKEGRKFLNLNIKNKVSYSINDCIVTKTDGNGSSFQIRKITIHSKLGGSFNIMNMLGAIAYAKFVKIPDEIIKKGLEDLEIIKGRLEKIYSKNKSEQNFEVVVDYAHTSDSLKAIYTTYKNSDKICVLGNTGGGRDKWKRKEMAKVADEYCKHIILTNEDPYDEDPEIIVKEMAEAIGKKVEIIMDRRTAIRFALQKALTLGQAQGSSNQNNFVVLITGKGTDPYIMGPNGTREPWDDAQVTREELDKVLN